MPIRPGADHEHNLERAAADGGVVGRVGALWQNLNQALVPWFVLAISSTGQKV
jgi:hypothetical protein